MRKNGKKLLAGFSRRVITPENGVQVDGYFVLRRTEGVLDDIEAHTLALSMDGTDVLVVSLDLCHVKQDDIAVYLEAISEAVGIPKEHIFMTASHTHTGPVISKEFLQEDWGEAEENYYQALKGYLVEGAKAAMADRKPARMGWAVGNVPGFAFSRRFRMKDGSVRTNPGMNNPDVKEPIGVMDERVGILRFDREEGDSIVLVNIGQHPDSVGGSRISADWPGFMRKTLERSIPGVKSMYVNGAEGDVSFVNIWAHGGDLNDLTPDFDDVLRGYGHARHMGNQVAGAVLQVYDKVNYVPVDSIRCAKKEIKLPSNMPDSSELAQAHKYYDLHMAGKDDEIPYQGMELTTVVAEAERMVRLEQGPEYFSMNLTAIAIGDVVLIGIPGEPFAGVGIEVKKNKDWKLIMPASNTNGAEGYFPMKEAYDEGGYEARSSYYKSGVAEILIDECSALLDEVR